jgi:DNA-directed RNA polymerase subunit RPC12/RpoP
MPVIFLKLKSEPQQFVTRPSACPYCGSKIIQRWGKITKIHRQTGCEQSDCYRYHCNDCRKTFSETAGVERYVDSEELVQSMAGLAWLLGMSVRDVVGLFSDNGYSFSRMTVWREGQRLSRAGYLGGLGRGSRRFALDPEYVQGASSKLGVVIAFDFGNGKPIVLGTVDESQPRIVKEWLEAIVDGEYIQVRLTNTNVLESGLNLVGANVNHFYLSLED